MYGNSESKRSMLNHKNWMNQTNVYCFEPDQTGFEHVWTKPARNNGTWLLSVVSDNIGNEMCQTWLVWLLSVVSNNIGDEMCQTWLVVEAHSEATRTITTLWCDWWRGLVAAQRLLVSVLSCTNLRWWLWGLDVSNASGGLRARMTIWKESDDGWWGVDWWRRW